MDTAQLGAGRRLKEAQEFVAQLQAAVDAVEYEAPELSNEVVKVPPTFKDVWRDMQEAGAAVDDVKKSSGTFRGLTLSGRTLSKGASPGRPANVKSSSTPGRMSVPV
jgi:hypothetical protein